MEISVRISVLQNGKRSMTSSESMFRLYHSWGSAAVDRVGGGRGCCWRAGRGQMEAIKKKWKGTEGCMNANRTMWGTMMIKTSVITHKVKEEISNTKYEQEAWKKSTFTGDFPHASTGKSPVTTKAFYVSANHRFIQICMSHTFLHCASYHTLILADFPVRRWRGWWWCQSWVRWLPCKRPLFMFQQSVKPPDVLNETGQFPAIFQATKPEAKCV